MSSTHAASPACGPGGSVEQVCRPCTLLTRRAQVFELAALAHFAPAVVVALVGATAFIHEYPKRPYVNAEADERTLILLRSWLTLEQNRQWAFSGTFDVIGSNTGTRHRITCRPTMNVHQLDLAGRPVARWCFGPQGGLAVGDILLAQKVALETMEREALRVANREGVSVPFGFKGLCGQTGLNARADGKEEFWQVSNLDRSR
jgi:hypothetical protein